MSSTEVVSPTKEVGHDVQLSDAEADAQRSSSHDHDLDEKAKISDYKADAIEAENLEHNMSVLEAVRAYPMASFWAFVMSFTIVCSSANLCPVYESPLNRV